MCSKVTQKGKGAECPGSELLHISRCSKFPVGIFKCVKEHYKAQLSEYKEKHKAEHKPKSKTKENVPRYLESKKTQMSKMQS